MILSGIGYSTFLPTIIKGLGKWTPAQVQLLTIPCYFLGASAYMAIATVSDRTQKRGLFCVIFGILSVVGYAILLSNVSSGVHYFACFLVAAGLYIVVGLPLAWVNSCLQRMQMNSHADLWLASQQLSSLRQANDCYRHAAHNRQCVGHHVVVYLVRRHTFCSAANMIFFVLVLLTGYL